MKNFGPTPQLLVLPSSANSEPESHLAAVTMTLKIPPTEVAHPDITIINQDKLGIKIEHVRDLIANSAYPPYQNAERLVVLLHLDQASTPAQQSLLKFLEEPPSYERILLTTSQLGAVLPTIQSRCEVKLIPLQTQASTSQNNHQELLKKLLTNSLSYAESIRLTEKYTDRLEAIIFLQELITQLQSSNEYPSSSAVTAAQILSESWLQLHQNTNVRLTLEDCFFTIKSRF